MKCHDETQQGTFFFKDLADGTDSTDLQRHCYQDFEPTVASNKEKLQPNRDPIALE